MIAVSKYKAQIDANYNAAAQYYTARKKIFLSLYAQQYETNFNEANQMFFDFFRKEFDKFSQKVVERCEARDTSDAAIVIPKLQFNDTTIDTGITNEKLKGLKIAEVRRQLGFAYEQALQQYYDRIVEKTSNGVDEFISMHTGDIVQNGFTFTHGASIRADFGFGTMSRAEVPKNLELSSTLAYELAKENIASNPGAITDLLTSAGYLDSTAFFGGFSVKNYSDNIAYTHSKPLMNTVNQELLKLGPQASVDEGLETIIYFLSKYIIAISSPTVLGLYTKNVFIYMDDLLEAYRYYFHLREYKGAGRRPRKLTVQNSAIYLLNLGKNVLKYSVWGSRGKNAKQGKAIIKTAGISF